ncbi:unnamed protein product, partial [Symbiodinium microadriaticum]
KVATLFFLNKARAAAAVGTGAAVAACIAFGCGALPDDDLSSWWCLSAGCLAYLLAMLFWRPRQLVFVDRVCISQVNPELQAMGTLSLGAILKCSDTMLVLWDPTWARRLWCVYELAAFIRSRSPGEKPRVIIRPTLLGFTMFACWSASALGGFIFHFVVRQHTTLGGHGVVFLGLALCGLIFWYIAHLARVYCRDVTTMCQHIAHFSVATAESFCCSVDHKYAHSEERMMCDREVMQRCINIWFGGIEAFERQVQGDLYKLLVDQLANHMVSYWRLAEASPVFLWFHLDIAARGLRQFIYLAEDEAHLIFAIMQLLLGLSYWLGVVPILFRVMFRLAWAMQTKCACRLLDYTKSLLLLLPGICIFGAFPFLNSFLAEHLPRDLSPLGFALITIPLAALVWRNLPDGTFLVGTTPGPVNNQWLQDLPARTMKPPTLCNHERLGAGTCGLSDFMAAGVPFQALTDIAGQDVGGGAQLCHVANSQDESLVIFYPEVLAFSIFVGNSRMLPVPFSLLGARRYLNTIYGETGMGPPFQNLCGKVDDGSLLNEDILTQDV